MACGWPLKEHYNGVFRKLKVLGTGLTFNTTFNINNSLILIISSEN